MEFESITEIDAPVTDVWRLTLDVEALPEITPTMSAVERLDQGVLVVGSRVRIKQPGQPARVWTVIEVDAPHRFCWQTRPSGLTMTARHELTALDGGSRTRNRLSVEVAGPAAWLVGRLIGGRIRSAIATENAAFKTRAEGRSSQSPSGFSGAPGDPSS